MSRSREVLIRLGARICSSCGRATDVYQVSGVLTCYGCWQQQAMDAERKHQREMAELHGKMAVEMSDRPGSDEYRKACDAMKKDLETIAGDWKIGTGLFDY